MENEEYKEDFALTKENYKLIIIGVAVVFLGFFLMAGGGSEDPAVFTGGTNEDPGPLFSFRRITLAPFLCVGGFIFLIYAIMKKPKAE